MLLTESEARKRWCPFAGTTSIPLGANTGKIYDTRGESHGFTFCIASACMAWRETRAVSGVDEERCGYCGAAGKPIELE